MIKLFIFGHLETDEVINSLLRFKETQNEEDYYTAAKGLIDFSAQRLTDKNIICEYTLRLMLEHDNLPDITCLRNFLRYDIRAIYNEILAVDWDKIFTENRLLSFSDINIPKIETGLPGYVRSIETMIDSQSNEALGGAILAHVESFGTGPSAAYSALKWKDGKLIGIKKHDAITFDDLTGLEHQKNILIANTESFVLGKPANDVLLTGSSGTGKSSCVKACLNMFKMNGLRLIEVNKSDISELSSVFACIKNDILKYIVFIDDLSFEPGDMSYKILKSALDGQAEIRGGNILIYATSNRRGLIKETWADRAGYQSDEVHRSEGMAERKSLSARFGINLSFLTPTQTEYLKIVENMLSSNGVEMTEDIRAAALTWQINYNGFSGRTAKQFVASILAK